MTPSLVWKRDEHQLNAPWCWFYVSLRAVDQRGVIHFLRVNRLDRWIDWAIIGWLNIAAWIPVRLILWKAKRKTLSKPSPTPWSR